MALEVSINGTQIDITLEDEKTVGDVLRQFEEVCAKNNATTVNIILNGKSIAADAFDQAAQTPLADDTKLELTVIAETDLTDAFAIEAKTAQELSLRLEDIPVQLQSGKDKEAHQVIARLADLVDSLCQTASLATLFPSLYERLVIDGKNLGAFFADLSAVLADFKQALEDKDTVLIGDLSEYEISPRLAALASAIGALSAQDKHTGAV